MISLESSMLDVINKYLNTLNIIIVLYEWLNPGVQFNDHVILQEQGGLRKKKFLKEMLSTGLEINHHKGFFLFFDF